MIFLDSSQLILSQTLTDNNWECEGVSFNIFMVFAGWCLRNHQTFENGWRSPCQPTSSGWEVFRNKLPHLKTNSLFLPEQCCHLGYRWTKYCFYRKTWYCIINDKVVCGAYALVNAFQLPNRRKRKHFNLKFHNYNVNNWWLINNLATN